ncbi:MAG: Ig-like domain-containing protein [Candidatus Competibacteraceae bacterium]
MPTNAATDEDSVDPPDELGAAFNRTLSVDTAPTFVSSSPANGNVNVAVGSNIGINFNEAVNVTTSSFALNCGVGDLAYSLSGSGSNIISLDPSANLPGGANCTVTINGGNVQDSDSADPPNVVASSPSFSFTTQSLAEDDAYNVTPHLTLAVDTGIQGGRVTSNDQLGSGIITGFGFSPSCNATTPGSQHDGGAANGRLTLNADGSFSYEPPAGVAITTKTFCYTVSGGDTANIVFTLQNVELVWFVDAAAAAGGVGNQARPFQTLSAAAGADTANDTIFVKDNASAYTCGITLQAGEKLIGEGSGSTLQALSGVTPVTGSAFPTLTNNSAQWPDLTATANCVTLATNNTVRGFNFGNVGAANTALRGNNFGTLTMRDATINTNGTALSLITGTADVDMGAIASTGAGGKGVEWQGVSGSFTTSGITVQNSTGFGIELATSSGSFNLGTVTINTTTGAGRLVCPQWRCPHGSGQRFDH